MIPLPAGCSVTYSVWVDIKNLDNDMIAWFQLIGGETKEESVHDHRGKLQTKKFVKYGKSKWCYHHSGGPAAVRIHFLGEDISLATMFLLKFMENIVRHNMQETLDRWNRDKLSIE